jgi:hypothetical protein
VDEKRQGVVMPNILMLVEDLERAVRETASEHKLRDALQGGLSTLRSRYRRAPNRFGDREIARLHQLRGVLDDVTRSMDLMEKATYAQNAADYESLRRDLKDLAAKLAPLPIGQTLVKELQRLPVRPPAIQAAEKAQRQARQAGVISGLEASAERCPEGHVMKIRHSTRGPFWGCSEYPTCHATRVLKPEELTLLNSL